MAIKNISVIGLGKLGIPLLACLGGKGFKAIGVDIDPKRIRELEKGNIPFYEPGLRGLFRKARKNIKVTCDFGEAIKNTEATFIIVPTPSTREGNFSSQHVLDACRGIASALKDKKRYHLVIVTSTVTPATLDNEIRPTLESYSGKMCGRDFGLCYNPEFIALGSVIHDLYNPDFILIGESDSHAGDILSSIYKKFCDRKRPVARMNFVNAELTKLLVNTFVTMKISYANMIAHLCESMPGGDVDAVTKALGFDSRIGPKYLKGALGYGGPCFPRDNIALLYTAKHIGTMAQLADATNRFNRHQIGLLAKNVLSKLPPGGKVGILGLSYKPNTDVVEESQSILLARILMRRKVSLKLYDPVAIPNAKRIFNDEKLFASSAKECIRQSDLVIIATPWDEFRDIPSSYFIKAKRRHVVIDCWRILDSDKYKDVIDYIPLGIGLINKNRKTK